MPQDHIFGYKRVEIHANDRLKLMHATKRSGNYKAKEIDFEEEMDLETELDDM